MSAEGQIARKWDVFWWVFLAAQALFVLWLVVVIEHGHDDYPLPLEHGVELIWAYEADEFGPYGAWRGVRP